MEGAKMTLHKLLTSTRKECVMTTAIATRSENKVNVQSESGVDHVNRAVLISIGVAAAVIGVWAVASLASAVITAGLGPVARGFITAILG
jgi:hypothetical protein